MESAPTRLGLVREVWRKVPPVRSTVRTVTGSRSTKFVFERRGIVGVGVEQAGPAAPNADHFVALFVDPVDDGLDAGVQAGDVAAAGQDSDPHDAPLRVGQSPR